MAAAVIAFGCSIVASDLYDRCARPGIERATEPDSAVLTYAATVSVARSYNLILDQAAKLDGLEGLAIVHQDAELLDDDFCARLRAALSDPDVAIVGSVGAVGVNSMAWWDGTVTWNSAPYRQTDPDHAVTLGGTGEPGEVETLYGVLLAFSPWAVHNLRCDESIGPLHGYDYDLCRQARAAGRKVVTADLNVAHHHALNLVSEPATWLEAHMRATELWEAGAVPERDAPDEEWRPRARRAEAAAAAGRLLAASRLLELDAAVERDDRELEQIRSTTSWKLTEPLRRGNAIVRDARRRLKGY
jgi:hypothetical protein